MADEISQKRIIQKTTVTRSNEISQKKILQTDMYHIDGFDYEFFEEYSSYDYFYAIDTGRLFRVISGDEFKTLIPFFESMNNISIMTLQEFLERESIIGHYYYVLNFHEIDVLFKCVINEGEIAFNSVDSLLSEEKAYIVASDYDRRFYAPKEVNHKYYCIDTNQLWIYEGKNTWKFVAGDSSNEYIDCGLYDGDLIFNKTKAFSSEDENVETKATRVDNVVFCGITKANVSGLSYKTIATLDKEFRPNQDITVVIEKLNTARYNATISSSTGQVNLADASYLKNLTVDCKFWYIIE